MIFSMNIICLHIISLQVKRISLLIELVPILISQGVRTLASPSDDFVGAHPVESQLSLIPLSCALNHALQN